MNQISDFNVDEWQVSNMFGGCRRSDQDVIFMYKKELYRNLAEAHQKLLFEFFTSLNIYHYLFIFIAIVGIYFLIKKIK